jgi:hypothetical protein
MGNKTVAAVSAALLTGALIALSSAADPRSIENEAVRPTGDARPHEAQARYTVRGQGWATELFGRRHNRHLLAAVTPQGHRDPVDA